MNKKLIQKVIPAFSIFYKILILSLLIAIIMLLSEISWYIYDIRSEIKYDISWSLNDISSNTEYQFEWWWDIIDFDTSDLEYEIWRIWSKLDDVVSELDDVNDYLWDFDMNGIRINNY